MYLLLNSMRSAEKLTGSCVVCKIHGGVQSSCALPIIEKSKVPPLGHNQMGHPVLII